MLEAKTNCSFLSLMSLVSYGNWCGPGSNGKDPVDDVDACCQVNPSSHYSAKLYTLSTGTWHVLWHNRQVRVMRQPTPCLGHIQAWANWEWKGSLHRVLCEQRRPDRRCECAGKVRGSWLSLPGEHPIDTTQLLIILIFSKTCFCDVSLAACIAATGHCAPPLLGISNWW